MRVSVDIEVDVILNEDGYEVPGVCAFCQRCGHTTESYGQSDASIKRCLALMRETCPEAENNWYVADE